MIELKLKKGKEKILIQKHPWIFSGAIQEIPVETEAGEEVRLLDSKGQFVAIGHLGKGSIAIRILSRKDEKIDWSFWEKKLINALSFRFRVDPKIYSSHNNCFRWIHGEGDGLPGLIIDYYGGIAVIQCHSMGMYKSRHLIGRILAEQNLVSVDSVYVKTTDVLASKEKTIDGLIIGKRHETEVFEHDIHYWIDIAEGQKTGFFLDQRDNRLLLRTISSGKHVLNTFCYTGGFSLNAIMGGAEYVVSIDASKRAMSMLDRNMALNGFDNNKHRSICGDVMEYLKEQNDEAFDIIVLDPPAFAKNRKKRHQAVQAYKRLNVLGMQKLKPGGILMSFSCSQVVEEPLFQHTLVAAGLESEKNFRIVRKLSQGIDHPVHLYHPEGHYLKGFMLSMDD